MKGCTKPNKINPVKSIKIYMPKLHEDHDNLLYETSDFTLIANAGYLYVNLNEEEPAFNTSISPTFIVEVQLGDLYIHKLEAIIEESEYNVSVLLSDHNLLS